ncbi:MAG: metallophosphoesterase family protein [Pseudomonadota bacterium]
MSASGHLFGSLRRARYWAFLTFLAILSPANAADQIHWTFTGQTSVTFEWCGTKEDTIRYGLTSSYDRSAPGTVPDPLPWPGSSDSSACPAYLEAKLTGLWENTIYHYSIAGSGDRTFRTPVPRGSSVYTVVAQADLGSAERGYANVPAVQKLIGDIKPHFVLMPGDLTYADGGSEIDYHAHFNDLIRGTGTLDSPNGWALEAADMAIWGNHEWGRGSSDNLRNYKGFFDFPNSQASPDVPLSDGGATLGEDWYWFDYGNVRFIAYPEPYQSSAWTDWKCKMSNQLSGCGGSPAGVMDTAQSDPAIQFIVTFGHRPAYSTGYHSGDSALRTILDGLGDTYDKYVLNLNGHSHNYERSDPAQTHNVTHITAGTGGASLEAVSSGCAGWTMYRVMHTGPVRLRFYHGGLVGEFICGPSSGRDDIPCGSQIPSAQQGTKLVCSEGSVVDSFVIGTPQQDQLPQPPNTTDLPQNNINPNQQNPSETTARVGGGCAAGTTPLLLLALTFGGLIRKSRHSRPIVRSIFFMAATIGSDALAATTYYVSATSGNDGNSCALAQSLSTPKKSVAAGFGCLQAGDTLNLRGGTYFEAPTMSKSGTAEARITIQSYPGERATIDSGPAEFRAAGNSDWELVNAELGEYRSVNEYASGGTIYGYVAGIAGYPRPRMHLVSYQTAESFRAITDQYNSSAFYVGPGTFRETDGTLRIRLAKTTDMRNAEARYGQVFPVENADPRDYSIILSQASYTLKVTGSYLVFKDLTINQAQDSVYLDAGAHDITFDGLEAWVGDHAIAAKASPGAYNVKITFSRIYGDYPYWIFWSDMKDSPMVADKSRTTSVDMRYGAHDWEISYSHIQGSGQDLVGTNTDEDKLFVHHNRMENCGDDAFELEGTTDMKHLEIYENYIQNCLVAFSVAQDTRGPVGGHITGPIHIYRNVVAFFQNPPVNREAGINTWNGGGRFGFEYMFKQGGSGYTDGNTHYYQNTLVMLNAQGGINLGRIAYPADTDIANNILVMVNDQVHGSYSTGSNQIIDGDLYFKRNSSMTGGSDHLCDGKDTVAALTSPIEENGLGDTPKLGTDPRFRVDPFQFEATPSGADWTLTAQSENHKPSDFLLASDSPACGRGVPLRSGLPDSRAGAPADIGAYPCGTTASSLDVWPFLSDGPMPPSASDPTNPMPLSASGSENPARAPAVSSGCATSAPGWSLLALVFWILLRPPRTSRYPHPG